MIAPKDGEEGSLGSCGTLDPTEAEVAVSTGEVTEIPKKVLNPETGTLANSGELCRLVVGVA